MGCRTENTTEDQVGMALMSPKLGISPAWGSLRIAMLEILKETHSCCCPYSFGFQNGFQNGLYLKNQLCFR